MTVWIADCEAGSYGYDCKSTCGNCKISPCDFETGLCDGGCSAGWKGARCKSGECLDLRIEYELFPSKQSRIFYISFDDIIHSLTCLIYSGFLILCFPFCHEKKVFSGRSIIDKENVNSPWKRGLCVSVGGWWVVSRLQISLCITWIFDIW